MANTKKTVTAAAESKTATAKAAVKPAAEKKTAKTTAATEKKTTAKKTAATDTKKTAASKTPAKRSAKKTAVTIEAICAKIEKKVKTNAASIKDNIAVDIEVWGFEDGSKKMYIEVKDGSVTVAPFTYDAKDFRVSVSVANAVAFGDGKITLKELLSHDEFYAEGNIAKAVKLAAIF